MRKPVTLAVSQILSLLIRLMDTIGALFWYERRLSDAATKQKECAKPATNANPMTRKSNSSGRSQSRIIT
jgi:hypothetical protein